MMPNFWPIYSFRRCLSAGKTKKRIWLEFVQNFSSSAKNNQSTYFTNACDSREDIFTTIYVLDRRFAEEEVYMLAQIKRSNKMRF